MVSLQQKLLTTKKITDTLNIKYSRKKFPFLFSHTQKKKREFLSKNRTRCQSLRTCSKRKRCEDDAPRRARPHLLLLCFLHFFYLLLGERARGARCCLFSERGLHVFLSRGTIRFSRITHALSLSLHFSTTHTHKTTVLPAATQTRALERHDGYDLFGRDSVGDDRECVWNARHGVEGFSDRVEQEAGLLKRRRTRNETKQLYH